jgi:hypothetical protein
MWRAAAERGTDTGAAEGSTASVTEKTSVESRVASEATDRFADGPVLDLVAEVGSELARRTRTQRKADIERGYRDALQLARILPSPTDLDEIAELDFDVSAWIRPWRNSWARIAARLEPGEIPRWAWGVARYLGTLADPIGYDEFSFTPDPAYVEGLCDGLRAVHAAMHSADDAGAESVDGERSGDHEDDLPRSGRERHIPTR